MYNFHVHLLYVGMSDSVYGTLEYKIYPVLTSADKLGTDRHVRSMKSGL